MLSPCLPALRSLFAVAALGALSAFVPGPIAQAAPAATEWLQGKPETRVRLLAGTVAGKLYGVVEVELADDWKTYWKNPGDGGGVPPVFDFAGSANLGRADVLYPVPTRFADKAGDTLGFKHKAYFPIALTPASASQPLKLNLAFEYGICRDICVPVEATLVLVVPPAFAEALPGDVVAALDRVPRPKEARKASDPVLGSVVATLDGAAPQIVVEADFGADAAGAALYVDCDGPCYVPLAKPGEAVAGGPGRVRFVIALTPADAADLKGKDVKIILAGDRGGLVTPFKL